MPLYPESLHPMHELNFVQIQRASLIPNYGYTRTPRAAIERTNAHETNPEILAAQTFQSAILWPALFAAFPHWTHGLQGTGDCVAWMIAHMLDITDAIRNFHNPRKTELRRTCSESIYAFGKCELQNNFNFHRPGMMGLDGILAAEKFGRLLRQPYPGHDLTNYDGHRAITWAERPGATHGVPDDLEPEAFQHRTAGHVEITDCKAAAAYIEAGYPVGYCGETKWAIATDQNGFATKLDSGAHAMVLTGVQYVAGIPEYFWCANTGHGDHVTLPSLRTEMPATYRQCGSWLPARLVRPVLAAGDCFAITVHYEWNVHELPPNCKMASAFQ